VKTIVYVDGYNLYYGCLKYTPYKWLDLYKLFSQYILKIQSPQSTLEKVKFFTAPIKAKIASHGHDAMLAQERYHRALTTLYPETIEIIQGYYSLEPADMPRYQKPPDKTDRVAVWRLEEKQTDVNIALQIYRDVQKGYCDQVVVVSNDTDLEPPLKMIRHDFGQQIKIGVVIPVPKPEQGRQHRPPNARLSQYADWTRQFILKEELASSQLPDKVPTNKRPILKPDYW
jgi:uncharacterized LabA/DUF88 family protein